MHYAADITGAEIMRTIRDESRNRTDDITVLEFFAGVELVLNEHGHCAGAVLYNLETQEYFVVKAKAVIMATGGCGRLHVQGFMTTNHYGATADGIVLGYRAGVPVWLPPHGPVPPHGHRLPRAGRGHPDHREVPRLGRQSRQHRGQPVRQRARTARRGSSLDHQGVRQRTRRVSRPQPASLGIWLDSPMIEMLSGEGTVRREFPGKYILYKRFDIDISKEPMLIYPTLHYQNGGLEFQPDGA